MKSKYNCYSVGNIHLYGVYASNAWFTSRVILYHFFLYDFKKTKITEWATRSCVQCSQRITYQWEYDCYLLQRMYVKSFTSARHSENIICQRFGNLWTKKWYIIIKWILNKATCWKECWTYNSMRHYANDNHSWIVNGYTSM